MKFHLFVCHSSFFCKRLQSPQRQRLSNLLLTAFDAPH